MKLKVHKTYPLAVKKWWWTTKTSIESVLVEHYRKLDKESQDFYIKSLRVYGLNLTSIDQFFFYKLTHRSIEVCNINFYFGRLSTDKNFSVIEIADISIDPEYRSQGIGHQIMTILTKIAKDNSVEFIVGDLQEYREGEPLEDRKKFFINNGFNVKASQLSKFSGFIVKKQILSKL